MNMDLNKLRLNQDEARWLGVCAGVAEWLDVPATLVRIIFVICVLSWPTLIVGYFILYFCLDKDVSPESIRARFNDSSTADHFRDLDYRKPIYKNEGNKRIAGVCSGIADYLEVSAFAVRCVTLFSLFIFGPFTFWAYIICMFVFDPDPNSVDDDRYRRRSHRREAKAQRREARAKKRAERRAARKVRKSYPNDPVQNTKASFDETAENASAADADSYSEEASAHYYSRKECKEVFTELEMRMREMEAFMTSKKFRLHCEINRI